MQPLQTIDGIAVPLDRTNVDTDQIIPARFIMKPRNYDYGTLLFHDLRFGPRAESGFILDEPRYRSAKIMVTGANFGCGSAREQAAYALQDFGISALIGPSFGHIFQTNCVKNGILLAQVSPEVSSALCATLRTSEVHRIRIDLEDQTISDPNGQIFSFAISNGDKEALLSGKDDITRTLEHEVEIRAFEESYSRSAVWRRPTRRFLEESQ